MITRTNGTMKRAARCATRGWVRSLVLREHSPGALVAAFLRFFSNNSAVTGKAVQTGHSSAAVTHHEPSFRFRAGTQPIAGSPAVKARGRQRAKARVNAESEHLSAETHRAGACACLGDKPSSHLMKRESGYVSANRRAATNVRNTNIRRRRAGERRPALAPASADRP